MTRWMLGPLDTSPDDIEYCVDPEAAARGEEHDDGWHGTHTKHEWDEDCASEPNCRPWVDPLSRPNHFYRDVVLGDPATCTGDHNHPEPVQMQDKPTPLADSPRASALDEAKALITGDRNNQYGPPTQDFQRTAALLNALGYSRVDANDTIHEIKASDVAIIIAQVKVSRIMHTRGKRDSWVDLAGYAACGYECAVEEES